MDHHGARRGALPGPHHRGGRPAAARRSRPAGHQPDRRAGSGTCRRCPASRRQAEQCAGQQRGHRRADGLRHRDLRRRSRHDPGGNGRGNARLHRTRARARRCGHPRLGPVVGRRDALHGGRGTRPVRPDRRRGRGHRWRGPRGRPAGSVGGPAGPGHRSAPQPRSRHQAGRRRCRPAAGRSGGRGPDDTGASGSRRGRGGRRRGPARRQRSECGLPRPARLCRVVHDRPHRSGRDCRGIG